jgi:hypothetical protein
MVAQEERPIVAPKSRVDSGKEEQVVGDIMEYTKKETQYAREASVQSYLKELRKYPPLSREEEQKNPSQGQKREPDGD